MAPLFRKFENDNMNRGNGIFLRLVREPVVHFLMLGAALFVIYAHVGKGGTGPADRIVVDEAEVQRLARQFERTWMRPPSRQELEGLAEDFVREEIFYREALALGLDKDDLVVRRRMRQKMEFLSADLVEQQSAGEEELRAYLQAHPDKFRRPARLSFQQIYLDTGQQGPDDARRRAAAALSRLEAQPETAWEELGDATLLPAVFAEGSVREIAATFGSPLADTIAGAPLNRWSGPYTSEYGLHLVRVTARTRSSLPALTEIRAQVEREWTNERREQANERFYEALRERYSVEIRLPGTEAADRLVVHHP
jgi:hypothetical protein